MTDIVLNNIASGYNLQKINDNFEKIEDVINDEVVHNTGSNNVMQQDLDINGRRILNIPTPVLPTDIVRLQDLTGEQTIVTVQDFVSYEDFGADPTGIIPFDDAMIAAHEYANSTGLKVIQNSGIFYWQNKTAFPKTNLDLSGMRVRMDENSGTAIPSFDQAVMFQFDRSEATIEIDIFTIDDLNNNYTKYFDKYSMQLPSAIFAQYAGQMIEIRTDELDVYRFGDVGQTFLKKEKVSITREGGLEQYLTFNYGGKITGITVYPREDSFLEVKLPTLLLQGVGSFTLLKHTRSKMDISCLSIIENVEPAIEAIREIIHSIDCMDIHTHDFDAQANPRIGSSSSYTITTSGTIRATYERIRGNGGYGFTGSNYARQADFNKCWINRIDYHWGCYDLNVTDCHIMSWGILISGGNVTATNNNYYVKAPSDVGIGEFTINSFIKFRADYGANCEGTVKVDGLNYIVDSRTFDTETSRILRIIDFQITNTTADYGRAMQHGRTILVNNVNFQINGDKMKELFENDNMEITGVNFGVSSNNPQDQIYPSYIKVSNITFSEQPEFMAFTALVPPRYMNLRARGSSDVRLDDLATSYNMKIDIEDIHVGMELYGANYRHQKTCLVNFSMDWIETEPGGVYPAYTTDAGAIRPWITIRNCHTARVCIAMVGRVDIYDSTVAGLQAVSGSGAPYLPTKDQLLINIWRSKIRLVSSQNGSDSWEIPEQTYFWDCVFDDLMLRDGTRRVGSYTPNITIANPTQIERFAGKGNRSIAKTTVYNIDTPYFWSGENKDPVNRKLLANPTFRAFKKNLTVDIVAGELKWERAVDRDYTDMYGNTVSGLAGFPRQGINGWLVERDIGGGNQDIISMPSYGNIPDIISGNPWGIVIHKGAESVPPAILYYLYRIDLPSGEFRAYIDTAGVIQIDYGSRQLIIDDAHLAKQIAIIWDGNDLFCYFDTIGAGGVGTGSISTSIGDTMFLWSHSTGGGQPNMEVGEFSMYAGLLTRTELAELMAEG